jgi:hypothetical protein
MDVAGNKEKIVAVDYDARTAPAVKAVIDACVVEFDLARGW